jgi:hypothetical protein
MCYYEKPDDIKENNKKKKKIILFFSNEYVHLLAMHGTSLLYLGVFSLARYDTFFFSLNDGRIKKRN